MFMQSVTIYNKTFDKTTGEEVFTRTVLKGVELQATHYQSSNTVGYDNNNRTLCLVPLTATSKDYLDPFLFAREADKTGFYTIAGGDLLVPGEILIEIEDLDEFRSSISPVFTVIGVEDFRGGPVSHFEVVCA